MEKKGTEPKMLFVDISKCLACRSCELACAIEHSVSKELTEAIQESPRPAPRVSVEAAGESAVPLQCRHCEDAPCITVCPTAALEKLGPSLPVLIKEERCIGCRFCVMVCPFGVITLRQDGKVALKCDLCLTRCETGAEPACVEACHTGALQFLSADQIAARKRRAAAKTMAEASRQSEKLAAESK